MIIELTQEEIEWLNGNLRFPQLSDMEQSILFESVPHVGGEKWIVPDFAYEHIKGKVEKFTNLFTNLNEKMEVQTIRGILKINLGDGYLNE